MPPKAVVEIDIVAWVGVQRCRAMIQDEYRKPTSTIHQGLRDCWVTTHALNREGYARRNCKSSLAIRNGTSARSDSKTIYLQRIAYVARTGQNLGAGMQASHICDRAGCFNPQHIVEETGLQNRSRTLCRGEIHCPHHNWHLVQSFCNHNPRCVKALADPADFFCCGLPEEVSEESGSSSSRAVLPSGTSGSSNDQILGGDYSDLPPGSLAQGEDSSDDEASEDDVLSTDTDSDEEVATPHAVVLVPASSPDVAGPGLQSSSAAIASSPPGRPASSSPPHPPPAKRRKAEVGEDTSSSGPSTTIPDST